MTLHKWAAIALVICLAAARDRGSSCPPAPSSAPSPTRPAPPCPARSSPPPTSTRSSRAASTTDASGQYTLPLLPLGKYKVDVALDGFKNFSQTGIVLEVGRNARIDATIEPGNVSEVVSVVADAPLIETTTASLSRAVSQNEVLNLPLVNRDLYSLLSITGGVTSNDASNSLGGPEQTTTINGSQKAQIGTVNFQLDGGNNTAGLRGTGNPAPNPGSDPGIPRHHQQLRGRVRPLPRRRRRRGDQVGHQPVSRRGVRVLPRRVAEREALGAAGHDRHQGSARSQSVRRGARRPHHAGQDVFLHQLLGPAPDGDLLSQHRRRADRARAQR